jgi:hypothetical protein
LSGLFDFFQSASNTVADNVAGPVDLINAGLGLFGLRSKEPVGGSEWMKRWGLKRDVGMGGARLAGETAGLLSPALLAAKAPQIAKGLLQAQENAAIPRQMNPQMGAIVYHGSPHKFDKFDSSKIGTGEGAQAYGHGLYLADAPDVAKEYQTRLSTNVLRDGNAPRSAVSALEQKGGDADAAIKMLLERGDDKSLEGAGWLTTNKGNFGGNLYKVDLPDTAIAKMLDWDKPLSQQAPEVQRALIKHYEDTGVFGVDLSKLPGVSTGAEAYRSMQLSSGVQDASKTLREAGIPGIRYLDGGSRATTGGEVLGTFQKDGKWFSKIRVANRGGVGFQDPTTMITTSMPFKSEAEALSWAKSKVNQGTSNYVVFPGEEHLLKILERNGGLMGP